MCIVYSENCAVQIQKKEKKNGRDGAEAFRAKVETGEDEARVDFVESPSSSSEVERSCVNPEFIKCQRDVLIALVNLSDISLPPTKAVALLKPELKFCCHSFLWFSTSFYYTTRFSRTLPFTCEVTSVLAFPVSYQPV